MKFLIKFFGILLFLELTFRLLGVNQTSEEKLLDYYSYKYKTSAPTWFHTWPANTSIEYGNGEFLYHNSFNELGHRELSFNEFESDTSFLKIVFLGDSFTEGDGAPYDSSWVRFFEKDLEEKLDTTIWAYNAGVCGSDALFNGIMLKEKLLQAQPKIVFECINNSDITDIYYRGGPERFLLDGTLGAPNEKNWETLYKYSYLFRAIWLIFTDYDNNLVNTKNIDEEEKKALNILIEQIQANYSLCKQQNIDYHVIMMPVPSDILYKEPYIFDSLAYYLPKEIPLLNIYKPMYKQFDTLDIQNYSWEINGHFNGKGYEVMSSCILKELMKNNPNNLIYAY